MKCVTAQHPFVTHLQTAVDRMRRGGIDLGDVATAVGLVQFLPGVFAAAYDEEGRYAWASESLGAVLNFDPATLMGRCVRDVFPQLWCDERIDTIKHALRSGVPVATVEIFRGRRLEGLVLPTMDRHPLAVLMARFGVGWSAGGSAADRLPQAVQLVHADWGPLSGLSRRELEILRYLAAGQDNTHIAATIHRTKRAVEWHIGHLYTMLGCLQRTDLMRIGMEAGLHTIDEDHWSRMLACVPAIRETEPARSPGGNHENSLEQPK